MVKTCKDCNINKPIEEFSFKDRESGRRDTRCKMCHSILRKKYYENNKQREINNAYRNKIKKRKELKEYVKSIKLKCNRCNESHPATLQFHHINPSGKDDDVAKMVHKVVSLKKLQYEISKCEILCANCHAKEHYEGE